MEMHSESACCISSMISSVSIVCDMNIEGVIEFFGYAVDI